MTRPFDSVADAIAGALTPHLGPLMARAAIETHAKKLGIVERPLEPSDIEALLAKLRLGLLVFVGAKKTERILAEARRALDSRAGENAR